MLQQPHAARAGHVLWRWGQCEWQRGAKLGLVRSHGHSHGPGSRCADPQRCPVQMASRSLPRPHTRSGGVKAGPAPRPPAPRSLRYPLSWLLSRELLPAPASRWGPAESPPAPRRAILAQQLSQPPAVISRGCPTRHACTLSFGDVCSVPAPEAARVPPWSHRAAPAPLVLAEGQGRAQVQRDGRRLQLRAQDAARPMVAPATRPTWRCCRHRPEDQLWPVGFLGSACRSAWG